MNNGKRFEQDFKDSCKDEVAITRLYDPVGGQAGVANICDFIVGYPPYTFYLELKATSTGTLPLRNISSTQFSGLLDVSKFDGNIGGLVIKYIKYGEHFYVPITEVLKVKTNGGKSIQYKKIKDGTIKAIPFPSSLKRTRYTYDFPEFVRRYKNEI